MYMKSENHHHFLLPGLTPNLVDEAVISLIPDFAKSLAILAVVDNLSVPILNPQPLKSFTIPGVMAAVIGNLMKINDL